MLAVATYQLVRSANRSTRVAERSLLEGVRPVLIPSAEQDPDERVRFGDDEMLDVPGRGQRTITRFGVTRWDEFEGRRASVIRYWNIDREDPR